MTGGALGGLRELEGSSRRTLEERGEERESECGRTGPGSETLQDRTGEIRGGEKEHKRREGEMKPVKRGTSHVGVLTEVRRVGTGEEVNESEAEQERLRTLSQGAGLLFAKRGESREEIGFRDVEHESEHDDQPVIHGGRRTLQPSVDDAGQLGRLPGCNDRFTNGTGFEDRNLSFQTSWRERECPTSPSRRCSRNEITFPTELPNSPHRQNFFLPPLLPPAIHVAQTTYPLSHLLLEPLHQIHQPVTEELRTKFLPRLERTSTIHQGVQKEHGLQFSLYSILRKALQ